ncbi:terminase small subunit [Sulfitobacter pontiacus]
MIYKDKIVGKRPPWRPRKFGCPEQLAEQFVNYANYMEDNPLLEIKLFFYRGEVVTGKCRKPRPMTIESFSSFLGISSRTWRYWKLNREDLAEIIEIIEDAIFDHLFCLATANLVKANLISRKLGLPCE